MAKSGPNNTKLAIAAAAAAILIARHKDIQLIPKLLEPNGGQTRKMLIGGTLIFAYEKLVGRILKQQGLSLPPSLVAMITVFVLLKAFEGLEGKERADRLADYFSPAVDHLGKWMPLYLTPPLVVLPNALDEVQGGDAKMWAKLAAVHAGGWLFTLVTTALITRYVQEQAAKGKPQTGAAAPKAKPPAKSGASAQSKAERMRRAWVVIAAASYLLVPYYGDKPAKLSTTVLALLYGNALPSGVKKVLHPLVVCSVITGLACAGLGHARGVTAKQAFSAYFPKGKFLGGGPGDLFFGLLGASCTALGFRVFQNRDILQRNLAPLLAGTAASSMLSLWGTTAVSSLVGLPAKISATLAQRSVMSSLGIPAAVLLGGEPTLAVASILVTGVYGASLGQSILDNMGIQAEEGPVARGTATGCSAHSIGTVSLMAEEPEAAAVSSVALCLAGVFHTLVCSVPAAQVALKSIAAAGNKHRVM